jgi:hypothetical protein
MRRMERRDIITPILVAFGVDAVECVGVRCENRCNLYC